MMVAVLLGSPLVLLVLLFVRVQGRFYNFRLPFIQNLGINGFLLQCEGGEDQRNNHYAGRNDGILCCQVFEQGDCNYDGTKTSEDAASIVQPDRKPDGSFCELLRVFFFGIIMQATFK